MTDITANLGLPVIAAAQAQKHVTHNEALRVIDTLLQLAVLDRDLSGPPGSPSEGQRWIVGSSPTGAWAGHADHIAAWQDGAWQFSTPRVGWLAFVADEGLLVVWNGSAWAGVTVGVGTLQNMALLGVGTTADTTNPFSAKLNNALWVAKSGGEGGDGNLRYKMSKESDANTLSVLLQTNFSGRAELGLTGDDNFHIKVSPDGSIWHEGLTIDRSNGLATVAGLSSLAQIVAPACRGGEISIADNEAKTIALTGTQVALVAIVSPNASAPSGLFVVRTNAATAPTGVAWTDVTNVAYATGTLSGTTGTDGKLTLSSNGDGLLAIENRLGGTRAWGWSVLSYR